MKQFHLELLCLLGFVPENEEVHVIATKSLVGIVYGINKTAVYCTLNNFKTHELFPKTLNALNLKFLFCL